MALGLLIDGLAGTWPSHYPDAVHITLNPSSDKQLPALPAEEDLLKSWRSGRYDACLRPRVPAEPNLESWVAKYRPALVSAKVQGKTAVAVERHERERVTVFTFRDDALSFTVTPSEDMVELRVENRTARSAKVRWDDSVFVDFDHVSNPIGRSQSLDSKEATSSSVIAPGTAILETVFPMSRVYEASSLVRSTDQGCLQQCRQSGLSVHGGLQLLLVLIPERRQRFAPAP